jgi:hypothetical protein
MRLSMMIGNPSRHATPGHAMPGQGTGTGDTSRRMEIMSRTYSSTRGAISGRDGEPITRSSVRTIVRMIVFRRLIASRPPRPSMFSEGEDFQVTRSARFCAQARSGIGALQSTPPVADRDGSEPDPTSPSAIGQSMFGVRYTRPSVPPASGRWPGRLISPPRALTGQADWSAESAHGP